MNKVRFIFVLLLVCAGLDVSARSISPRVFGHALVADDKIVFNGPEIPSHRLICIQRESGEKLWEITDTNRTFRSLFLIGKQVIIQVGNDLCICDPGSGNLKTVYETQFRMGRFEKLNENRLLALGDKENVYHMEGIDPVTWQKAWEIPHIMLMLAQSENSLLCTDAERKLVESGGYQHINEGLCAVDFATGKILWRKPLGQMDHVSKAGSVSNHYIAYFNRTVHCYKEDNGTETSQVNLGNVWIDDVPVPRPNQRWPIWLGANNEVQPRKIVSCWSVPELKRSDSPPANWVSTVVFPQDDFEIIFAGLKTDARKVSTGASISLLPFWQIETIFDGVVYFGDLAFNPDRAALKRLDLRTGQTKTLYEEKLP